jgi:hypothetical protein
MPVPHAGYIGSESLLKTIVRLVDVLRQRNPNLTYGACLRAKVHFMLTKRGCEHWLSQCTF